MSVRLNIIHLEPGADEEYCVGYSFEYTGADGATQVSVSYEERTAADYEAAAEAIATGGYYYSRGGPGGGEASFEITNGVIEFEQYSFGHGHDGSLMTRVPAAPWEAAFRELAVVLRTGELPSPGRSPRSPEDSPEGQDPCTPEGRS